MIELPINCQDIIVLADWLELVALKSGDKNASVGDLTNALQIAVGKDKASQLALEVFRELEERIKAASSSYPFVLEHNRVLQAREKLEEYVAYLFCLLLSYFDWKQLPGDSLNPRLLFEELACIAAKQYFRGKVCLFGTARSSSGGSGFEQAVNKLCKNLGEGGRFSQKRALSKKDDHVDLVIWRDFEDRYESKLVIFGQCATGKNWIAKVAELQPDAFWNHWMSEGQVSPLGRSFYIPHRISDGGDREEWKYYARQTGILFDRCRVAYWAWTDNDTVMSDARYLDWCQSVLSSLGIKVDEA